MARETPEVARGATGRPVVVGASVTHRERWSAAVALQQTTVAQLDACDDVAEFARLDNEARDELFRAAWEREAVGDRVPNEEWCSAYNAIRVAEFRFDRRARRRSALAEVDAVATAGRIVLARCAELFL